MESFTQLKPLIIARLKKADANESTDLIAKDIMQITASWFISFSNQPWVTSECAEVSTVISAVLDYEASAESIETES